MDVGGLWEDEYEISNNVKSCPANKYPDLDYVPSYPWLGERSSANDDESLCNEQATRHDHTRQDLHDAPQRDASSEVLNTSVNNSPDPYALPHTRQDPSDASLDPDFQLSDDGATYVPGKFKFWSLLILDEHRSDDYISEEDSDFQNAELQAQLERLANKNEGRSNGQQRGGRGGGVGGRGRHGQGQRGGGKGVKKGQRKPLEPSMEFKILHSQATMAFIDCDYEEAEKLVLQAILVNPEMYTARSLLSEIHMARGDKDKAITALFHAAHTKPRDTQVWLKLAQLLLERDGEDRPSALRDAIYCYGRIIGMDSTNVGARYQRAALNRELGYIGRAAQEYEYLFKQLPHDTTVLRHLAETYIELGDVDKAVAHYNESITHFQEKEPYNVTGFSWSDVNIYVELYGYQNQYEKAIMKLKALSRWLLGRGSDPTWEQFDEDDREWDSEDHPRRVEVPGFEPGAYKTATYGDGIPLELRVKLGVYRLKAINSNLGEAIVSLPCAFRPKHRLTEEPEAF